MRRLFKPYYFLLLNSAWGWLLVLPLFFSSCKKNFSSNQFEDDQVVVLAEISAGDSVKIPIGKTIRVGNGSLISFEKVNDATVTITEAGNLSWVLQPNYSLQYTSNPTSVFTNKRRFKANTTYSIEINHPVLGLAKATTHIPALPRLVSIDTASDNYQNQDVLKATITWQDGPDPNDLYIIEALKEMVKTSHYFYYQGKRYNYDTQAGNDLYQKVKNVPGVKLLCDTIGLAKYTRLNLYTEDNNSENARIDKLEHPFRRVFFTDQAFNGQTYTTHVYIDKQFFIAANKDQRGRIRVQLKAISKDLYNYLLLYEKYKTDFGTVPTNQLTSPSGNITNGIGIFGGSARREHFYYYDTLL